MLSELGTYDKNSKSQVKYVDVEFQNQFQSLLP